MSDRLAEENARLQAALCEVYFVADAPGEDIRATVEAALGYTPGAAGHPSNPKPLTYEAAMRAYEGACSALSRALHQLAIAVGE